MRALEDAFWRWLHLRLLGYVPLKQEPTMTDEIELLRHDVVQASKRLKIEPHCMLAAILACSVARRGSHEWSQHDLDIAESVLGAFIAAGGLHEVKP